MLPGSLAPRKRRTLAKGQGLPLFSQKPLPLLAIMAELMTAPFIHPPVATPSSRLLLRLCVTAAPLPCAQDLTWYAKSRQDENLAALKEEKRLAKEQEEDMMRARLGLAPLKRRQPTGQLDQHEMKELLKRGGKEDNDESAERGKERHADAYQ